MHYSTRPEITNSKDALIKSELTPPSLNIIIACMPWERTFSTILVLIVALLILGRSSIPPGDQLERVRSFTREIEFDYTTWTADALGLKFGQLALRPVAYVPEEAQRTMVLDYLELVSKIQREEAMLNAIYADPNIADAEAASQASKEQLAELYDRRKHLEPLAETIMQNQVSQIIAEYGLTISGQPTPPILYHSSPLPQALIVSPRETIRQDHNISLNPNLTVDQQAKLEDQVDHSLKVSSLVVDIGGIGVYPTMVMQTGDLNWLTEVIAHEWIHNFLTLRPLGMNYLTSPELRTMNETAASIAGKEIGRAWMERYYPELLPPPVELPAETPDLEIEPPVFDFRAEMRQTRLTVDQLLSKGNIDEAETYMEERRRFFWENGYRIRKLNQAYFAFHGAYADIPGGAAGEDPVGAAVRALRTQSPTLTDFIKRISWMSSYESLQKAIDEQNSNNIPVFTVMK